MNKEDCRRLRTGDVIEVSHGFDKVERCSVTGPVIPSRQRGARVPVRRHRDNAEYTVYSSRIVNVVLIKEIGEQ